MYLISKISASRALRGGMITIALLMLLLLTSIGASSEQAQAHTILRPGQLTRLQSRKANLHKVNRGEADPNATITRISVSFFTHNDNKDHDTSVSVFVQNRASVFLTQDLAKLENFAGNTEFGDNPPSMHTYDLILASENIKLSSINVPTFRITSAPVGHDRWIFDVTITITTSDGSQFSSTTPGIILDQDNRTFNGAFGS